MRDGDITAAVPTHYHGCRAIKHAVIDCGQYRAVSFAYAAHWLVKTVDAGP
jgi:succinate dehydrogenase/fumarate reductase cytochrome b subunit